jgi:hypothetical protein
MKLPYCCVMAATLVSIVLTVCAPAVGVAAPEAQAAIT